MEQSGHITLAAETIGHIFDIPVTNTLLVTWVSSVVLIVFAFASTRKMTLVPVSYLQGVAEVVIETGYNLIDDLAHGKVKTLLPILMTFFLYIITANWIGLLPGFGTIGFYGQEMGKETFVPLFRSINSDLNATLALALVSVVGTHIFAIKYLGLFGYIKKWFSFNPIMLFVGLLELFSEFTKIVSLSFRLFGNIFAGEAVLATISSLFAFVLPLPFYFLEIIVGFVQAAVFMMLTLVFIVLLTQKHDEA
ncbi:MAG: ATP synthase F0 subunit A [Candidatus Woykebacteria bacterium RIFCSPHIGHO2_12_FULL_43_10]|uniref:ATP synthase subunit a n=2 Tax=Candidatus Woykeibacteriota TaxID=1817899 RepID=A0A1G1WWT2_9BACT|nr:MAG: ATP synthase F0 subunit A [Candidatus Woykebacteria bacterium RIFCSPHIGHO2_01_FULL_43_29]OGY28938.1 MAG: ATP synthase F0 subunit A [Candidatus Woykebacteria bacterium RIFCSPHIGHO2_12_FULL_43_10]OGY29947.1 MAG: ATP synthase F0 subunit A [Candidatus Woykebacteria bacterium RIFCSPHIGHO2_02_FULL_43_16b]OGY32202.1 MAG: ATP synthase F0 subunit A [Candidatus Woykebacteria bacterium RIFCSPLOWO2_01_FULL_43_14]